VLNDDQIVGSLSLEFSPKVNHKHFAENA